MKTNPKQTKQWSMIWLSVRVPSLLQLLNNLACQTTQLSVYSNLWHFFPLPLPCVYPCIVKGSFLFSYTKLYRATFLSFSFYAMIDVISKKTPIGHWCFKLKATQNIFTSVHDFSKKEFAYSSINCNNKTEKSKPTWVFPILRTVKPFFFEGWPFEISGILKSLCSLLFCYYS